MWYPDCFLRCEDALSPDGKGWKLSSACPGDFCDFFRKMDSQAPVLFLSTGECLSKRRRAQTR